FRGIAGGYSCRPVYEQIREFGRQDDRFNFCIIKVIDELHCVFPDIPKHFIGDFRQSRFCITHCSRRVPVHAPFIAVDGYELFAMVRLSQEWKMREELITIHGNKGSVDGDPPAAMRYTEARLSEISNEMLRDIRKNTVQFINNFDDTEVEPVVLPAKFPNLLVNGTTGISA